MDSQHSNARNCVENAYTSGNIRNTFSKVFLNDSDEDMTNLSDKGQVLIFEDNPVNQIVTRKLLESAGYEVDVAENGKIGIEMYEKSSYDIIIMDIQMPVMDGYEATKAIRAMSGNKSGTPIIALTANAFTEDREKCLAAGMDDYIAKPFKPNELFEAIDGQLKAH